MAALSPDESAAGKTTTLVAFVQRARRIQTHSLTQNQDAPCALKYMIGGMISAHPDGTVTEIKALPPQGGHLVGYLLDGGDGQPTKACLGHISKSSPRYRQRYELRRLCRH
jgi:hypothetical protein